MKKPLQFEEALSKSRFSLRLSETTTPPSKFKPEAFDDRVERMLIMGSPCAIHNESELAEFLAEIEGNMSREVRDDVS